jgi:hypothetical protein
MNPDELVNQIDWTPGLLEWLAECGIVIWELEYGSAAFADAVMICEAYQRGRADAIKLN